MLGMTLAKVMKPLLMERTALTTRRALHKPAHQGKLGYRIMRRQVVGIGRTDHVLIAR